jgi:tetratricopeptide (TPR) repeat protein
MLSRSPTSRYLQLMRRAVLGLSTFFFGCAGAAPGVSSPERIQVLPEIVITKTDPASLPGMFHAASDKLMRDEFKSAAEMFEQIYAVDPQGETARPSLYNAAIAYMALGKRELSLDRFAKSVDLFPESETTRSALLRIARLQAFLERWPALEKTVDRLLARTDLTVLERLEVQGGRGLALVSMGRTEDAYAVLIQARNQIEDKRLGESGTPPIELALVSYALGEVKRVQSERIVFVPMPPDFGKVLEDRCTALLDAQSAYTDAMRARDAHFSAMSGYRIGQLYQELHRDVMKVPSPAPVTDVEKQKLWEGAVRLRYRVLLEKGLRMMEATVKMGQRTGEDSFWIARAEERVKELQAALSDEKDALAKMPYTEDEMRKALENLKKKP